MRKISELGFRIRPPKEVLLFLLGLFSTWQIIQLGGFAVSTWLTALTVGYLLLTHGFDFRKDWLLIALLVSTVLSFGASMLSDIPAEYKKASVFGTLQWGLIFLLCSYMRKEHSNCATESFLRGFDWSCRIQLIWCVLQMLIYYVLHIDVNAKLFGDLLHMNNETSQYRDGVLACTGLHWHAANLIPILVYTYFRHKSVFLKLLCIGIAYLTKNATALIAIGGAVGLDLVMFAKRTLCDRQCAVRYKVMVYAAFGVLGLLAVSPVLIPKLWEMVEYLLLRIYQIWNPSLGNESSAVHFNYYRNLPYILKNISIREVLFGSGLDTSGYRFTQFFGQYAESIWTVESDFVNVILNKGVLGGILQYGFLFALFRRMQKTKQAGMACFVLVLAVCGLVYDNQFLWALLLEYMLYCRSYQCLREK